MDEEKIGLMVEAERRGILPAEKTELLAEARRRGLVPPAAGAGGTPADLSAKKQGTMGQGPLMPPEGVMSEAPPLTRLMLQMPGGGPAGAELDSRAPSGLFEMAGKVAETARGLGATPEGVTTELPEAAVAMNMRGAPTALTTKVGALDVPLTAAEISQKPIYAQIEAWLAKAPLSSDLMQRFQKLRTAALNEYRASLLNKAGPKASLEGLGAETKEKLAAFGDSRQAALEAEQSGQRAKILGGQSEALSPLQAGEGLQAKVTALKEAARAEKNRLYQEAYKDLPPELAHFDAKELRAKARDILAKKGGAPSTLPAGLDRHLREIDATQGLSWQKLHDLQSDYGATAESIRRGNNGAANVESMIYSDLKTAARDTMERRAKEVGGDVWQKYDFARAFNREYKSTFDADQTVRRFLNAKPDQVFDSFVKRGSIEDLRKLKAIAGDAAFRPMKRLLVEDIVGAAGDKIPSGVEIARKLDNYKWKLPELLTPVEQAQVKRFAEVGELPRFVQTELEKHLAGLAKRTPTAVADAVMRGDPTIARAVKQIVGPQSWQPYRREFMERVLGEMGDDLFTSKKITKLLGDVAPEYRDLFVSPAEVKEIEAVADAKRKFETVEASWGNPSGTSKNLISWAHGAVAGGIALHNPAGGAAVLIAPPILAKFYLSPVGRRLLIDGLTAKEVNAAATFTRMAAFASNARREYHDEERRKFGLQPVFYQK